MLWAGSLATADVALDPGSLPRSEMSSGLSSQALFLYQSFSDWAKLDRLSALIMLITVRYSRSQSQMKSKEKHKHAHTKGAKWLGRNQKRRKEKVHFFVDSVVNIHTVSPKLESL